jgi:5-methylcytosine-specific restriction enzyme B
VSIYVSESDLKHAVKEVHGTAHHLLKVWFVLKQMGLSERTEVSITTNNSTDALKRLFSYGDPEERFYIPFAHTKRFETMMHDASRSIIQTTIQRWNASGSVVEVDPTNFLSIGKAADGALNVRLGRNYPQGLGYGRDGFALEDSTRVQIRLRQIRLAKGFTQESLADTVGLHRTYIGNIERGEESVSLDNAAKIAKALKVSLSELVKGL